MMSCRLFLTACTRQFASLIWLKGREGANPIISFGSEQQTMREGQEMAGFTLMDAEDMRPLDAKIDRLLRYVEDKTGGKRLPCRADVNPADLKSLLPDICFIEPLYSADGTLLDAIVRLEGTRIVGFYGELTNKSVREHPSKEVSSRILASVAAAIDATKPVVAEAKSLSPEQMYLTIRATYIPMGEKNRQIDRLLGYVQVFRR